MIAEFSIYPMGKLHYTDVLARMIEELKISGLEYQLGPMGTSIQGSRDQVFDAIERCLELAKNFSERVVMHVAIDFKETSDEHLVTRVEKVMGQLAN
ncbi:MAG: hypothetical protein EBR01_09515 [Proteobacteria bacterium]|nr:hypothetical protein [Pseudomonadota bacterium]NBY19938.1 hypothetical protein [bacterium]